MLISNTIPISEGFSSMAEAGRAINASFGILNIKEGAKYSRIDSELLEKYNNTLVRRESCALPAGGSPVRVSAEAPGS